MNTQSNGSGTGGERYDWGFPVVPTNQLTPQVVVGLGYGCTNNNCNRGDKVPRSPIWVTPSEDAFVFIDYNNTGARTGYDIRRVRRLEGIRIRNPWTSDMSGALIFARKWDPTNVSQTIATASLDMPEVDIAAGECCCCCRHCRCCNSFLLVGLLLSHPRRLFHFLIS
jgi:hypothetical protein